MLMAAPPTSRDITPILKSIPLRERSHIGPRVYPKGSLVIALVRVSVCVCVRL